MARPPAITAYGTADDRLRLAAISRLDGRSGSEILIEFVRTRYREMFGDLAPSQAVPESR
jgi:hypothetical protein